MADVQQIARPQKGEIVEQKVLTSLQFSSISLARGFGGISNPTTIYDSMMRDQQIAFYYYRELEEKDEDIAGALEELKLSILSREQSLLPKDETSQAAEVAAFIQQQLDRIPRWETVLEALLDAPAYGVAICELIFDVSMGQVSILEVKDRPQELFTFNPMFQPQIGPLRYLTTGTYDASGGTPVPENKFLIHSFRPRNGNRRGRPLLRSVFWPSWFKRQAIRFWLRFAEKGPGTAVAKYPQGASTDEQAKALAAAEDIINSIAVAVPENFELVVELLKSTRSQNPAVYQILAERMEMKISRRIVGQTLTSHGNEGGVGTQALGKVHSETKYEKTCAVARGVMQVINDQLIKPLVLWNFGPNAPMPKWSVDLENEENLIERANIDARLQGMGVPIPKSYALKKYAIPDLKSGDEALVPTAGVNPGSIAPATALLDPLNYSEEAARRATKNAGDVQRLFAQLKAQSEGIYRERIVELAKGAGIGGAQ